jgi:hypothetical protein
MACRGRWGRAACRGPFGGFWDSSRSTTFVCVIRLKKKSLLRLFTVEPLPSKRQLLSGPKKRERSARMVT